jgi:hypothetical protein
MKKVKFFNKYPTNIDIDTEKDVEVYIDEFNTAPIPKGGIRIVILEEPLKGLLFTMAQTYTDRYTHLLTYHTELLNSIPQARLLHSDCSRTRINNYSFPTKSFSVSSLTGGKSDSKMEGYGLRHDVWRNQKRIIIPQEFFLSSFAKWNEADYNGKKILGDDKTPLYDSQFHIAIENTSIKDYFTEKILDCFKTKTVPIYFGCTNIGDYFNTSGILIARNLDQVIDSCNGLKTDTYPTMTNAIEDNYERVKRWGGNEDRIKNIVIELIK